MAESYFDETIFTYGESLTDFSKINVFNKADSYLVQKQGIDVGDSCTPVDNNNSNSFKSTGEIIVNLNPRGACMGLNLYSLMPTNKKIKKLVSFNQISVFDGETTTPIEIGEHKSGEIYSVGLLTKFESAIMLKYFAINNSDVYITRHLYNFVKKYFQDTREWFNYNSIGVVQNHNNELMFEDEIINVPNVTIYSDAVIIN